MGGFRLVVIGTGYVGLTTGACLAELGHHTTCVDIDEEKVQLLRAGSVDILEPDLEKLVKAGQSAGRLDFVIDPLSVVAAADAVFLCLPTPLDNTGQADLNAIWSVLDQIGESLPAGCVLIIKSTVPVGTSRRLVATLHRDDISVVTNPEFLREGYAVKDFLHPDRIVIGCDDPVAAQWVLDLYRRPETPAVITNATTAEMAKYSANCFLAVKLSYINSIAELCDRLGADVMTVADAMGHDMRIGGSYLKPGPGWGGSCLPKDAHALLATAATTGFDFQVLRAAVEANERHRELVVTKIANAVGGSLRNKDICLLGLTFKAETNDLRDSPALDIAYSLAAKGVRLTAFDPAITSEIDGIEVVDDPYRAAKGVDAVVILTEWPEFRSLDWHLMATLMGGGAVVDTRNLLDPCSVTMAGLLWQGVGRPEEARSKLKRSML